MDVLDVATGRPCTGDPAQHPPRGTGNEKPSFQLSERGLRSGERLILVTDGIIDSQTEDGGRFGIEGLQSALVRAAKPTAAATAMSIQRAVTDSRSEPLEKTPPSSYSPSPR